MIADVQAAESVEEVKALVLTDRTLAATPEVQEAVEHQMLMLEAGDAEVEEVLAESDDKDSIIARLKAQIAAIRKERKASAVKVPKKYRLLSTDVKWSTKPQVHAIAEILSKNFTVGEVYGENEFVGKILENESLLKTRQGGKRIWDYYKGNHMDGLRAHNNIEAVN
jgi:Asp-tRNA(Asn)/Glu-tRNA(Gln) amidotransferase A subunit family amidase